MKNERLKEAISVMVQELRKPFVKLVSVIVLMAIVGGIGINSWAVKRQIRRITKEQQENIDFMNQRIQESEELMVLIDSTQSNITQNAERMQVVLEAMANNPDQKTLRQLHVLLNEIQDNIHFFYCEKEKCIPAPNSLVSK